MSTSLERQTSSVSNEHIYYPVVAHIEARNCDLVLLLPVREPFLEEIYSYLRSTIGTEAYIRSLTVLKPDTTYEFLLEKKGTREKAEIVINYIGFNSNNPLSWNNLLQDMMRKMVPDSHFTLITFKEVQ